MRIKKNIRLRIFYLVHYNLSELASFKNCIRDSKENYLRDLGHSRVKKKLLVPTSSIAAYAVSAVLRSFA